MSCNAFIMANVERMHSYQRERAWLAGLRLYLVGSILAERLVGVVMSRFGLLDYSLKLITGEKYL